jgi:hypothetical protein
MASQPGFFDVEERYAALSAAGDPLERLSAVVDFEILGLVLGKWLLGCQRNCHSRANELPKDPIT